MARPLRIGKKHDSHIDRIVEYHVRRSKALLMQLEGREQDAELDALRHLKSHILNPIIEHLDSSIDYSLVMQQGFLSTRDYPYTRIKKTNRERKNNNRETERLIEHPELDKFHRVVNDNDSIREKLERDHLDYINDVFTPQRISKLLSAMFFNSYKTKLRKNDETHRIILASMMLEKAINELRNYMPRYSNFIWNDLRKAIEIGYLITKQRTDREPYEYDLD